MTMSFKTKAFGRVADRVRHKPISAMTLKEIQKRRNSVLSSRFPTSLIYGRVPRGTTIRAGGAEARSGVIPLRVYEPAHLARPVPLVLFFHGGGWVTGNVQSYDPLCAQIAQRVGAIVVSVDYRLAPEHVFPAAVEDSYDATVWAVEHAAQWGADPSRVAVFGDSAGGNLSTVVCQLARDNGGPTIAAQGLIYPATDATLTSPSMETNAEAFILTRRGVIDFLDRYHPQGDRKDPLLSPLFAESLADLPPALIQTAQFDPLLDDGVRYAEALREAGVAVEYTQYDDVPHGFASFPGATSIGEAFHVELATFLRRHLSPRA